MSVTYDSDAEAAWHEGEAAVVGFVGQLNQAVAGIVGTIRMLLDRDGWQGHGIQSIEHWVCWKACVSRRRAEDLVRIARRLPELPVCWAAFQQGILTEEAMVLIARRVPAERDAELARRAPDMTISQLRRGLRALPDHGQDQPPGSRRERQRSFRTYTHPDGWGTGDLCLPPDEMALFDKALEIARDREFRDRHPDADQAASSTSVSWVDAFMRLVEEGLDSLDTTLQRTGYRGERTKVVLHHDLRDDGSLGPGRLHLGDLIPDAVARFLRCDAEITVVYHHQGRIVGVDPTQRIPNRATRRAIEDRDGGCAHPLCQRRVGLNVHHIQDWNHDGPTLPANPTTC